MQWDRFTHKIVITQARVVATISDGGGAIVEAGDIEFVEGRTGTLIGQGVNRECQATLGYYCAFGRPGAPAPDASEATHAYVVIDGQSEFGPIEIRGQGHIGYDDRGNLDGFFDANPEILLDDLPDPEGAGDEDMSPKDWIEHMKGRNPILSDQYVRALRGRRDYDPDD